MDMPSQGGGSSIFTALPEHQSAIQPHQNSAYMLPCEFVAYAACDQLFRAEEAERWMEHIIADHLAYQLPSKSACWYCDDYDFDTSRDGVDKLTQFRNRLEHIRLHIRDDGFGVNEIRPDYAFITHLEKIGLIAQPVLETAQSWQEGPVSGVKGIYAHDWEPPERQQQYGQSPTVVINETSRGRKSNKHSNGHKRRHRAHGTRGEAKFDDSSRTTHNKAESNQRLPSNVIPETGIPNMLHEEDSVTGINSSKHQKAVMAEKSKLKPETLKSEHLPPHGIINSTDELIGNHEQQSKYDRIPQHGSQHQLDPTSKIMKQQSHTSPPNRTSLTANEENETKDLRQTIQRTIESYPSSPSSFFSAVEVHSMLDEADAPPDADTLTHQRDLLAEGTETELEHLRKMKLSLLSTDELLGSHEKQSTSDRISLNQKLDVKSDVASLDSATAGGSSRQEVQAPTDSGYASGLHPKAMQVETHDEQAWNHGLYSAQTTYTYSNISSSEDRSYISEFATELAHVSEQLNLSLGAAEHILEVLPQLLRAFALRLGYNANSAAHREIYVFVHRYRFQIRKSLRSMLPIEDTGSDADDCETIRDTSLNGEFLINRFLQEPVAQEYLPIGSSSDAEDEQDEQDVEMDGHQFRGMIQDTKAYQWLITALKREATLMRGTPDIMQQVEADILSFLPESHTVSRREPPQAYTIEFQFDWNPLLFARQQEYLDPPDLSLQQAITLTGSSNNAQALTARQYLAQTWPNTGNFVMDLFTDAVRATDNPKSSSVLPDGTGIAVKLTGDKFIVTAKGIADTLVEVGQQFAWLGAALRSSPYDSGIATCVPVIERTDNDSPSIGQTISIIVTFAMGGPFLRSEELFPGACWHPMFRNPVMVSGYPIRSRLETGLGLEMPLNMMAELSGSTRADLFDGKVFLKGFSTMLIATKQAHDIIVWHYFYHADRERLSYFDHELGNIDKISLSSLDSARHVIGWCEDCKLFAGDPVLAGNIQRSRLPPPHAGCLLEKVNLSFSRFISVGVSMAVGIKDVPPHVTRNGYIPELRHLATRYVVLWDEAQKRGWLVNGTSALLHIVRASLQHWAKDDFSASFMFDASKMADATDHKPGSASRILSDPKNLELEIHLGKIERFDEEETRQKGNEEEYSRTEKRKKGYYLLGDLMEMRLTALRQMMDYQVHKAGTNGINIKSRIRTHLEGWDFFEVATDEELRPRVATLQALGYGWVDFVRSIGAITLLGRGFGEIIQPSEDDICPNWKRLPTQEYYLAVTTTDLINIIERFGNMYTEPKQLVPGLAWHSPDDLLAVVKCRCQGKRQLAKWFFNHSRVHRSPVQVPFPVRSGFVLPLESPQEFHEGGAVVFGNHISWKYPWSEDGRKGVMELESGLRRSSFGTSKTSTSNSCPTASETTASASQFSTSGFATPPTSMNPSVERSDISTKASTSDDKARRLRLEKRRISLNR